MKKLNTKVSPATPYLNHLTEHVLSLLRDISYFVHIIKSLQDNDRLGNSVLSMWFNVLIAVIPGLITHIVNNPGVIIISTLCQLIKMSSAIYKIIRI